MRIQMQRFLIVGLIFCCCGCGKSDGLQRAGVGGKVTLDGVDIAEGTISFHPSGNTKGPVVGGTIKNGQYSISIDKGPAIGSSRVEIHAWKKTGRKVQVMGREPAIMIDERVDLPSRYNVKSILVAEIKSHKNVFDYELSSY